MAGISYTQAGWVVPDLMRAVDRWLARGVGPFFIIPEIRPERFSLRGTPGAMNISVGLAQAGGIQIELIQPNGDQPSPYSEVLAAGGGLHHFAAFTQDMAQTLAAYRETAELVADGRSGDMEFAYLDTRLDIGCMTEIMQPGPVVSDLFRTIAEASRDWDGSAPVRIMA